MRKLIEDDRDKWLMIFFFVFINEKKSMQFVVEKFIFSKIRQFFFIFVWSHLKFS